MAEKIEVTAEGYQRLQDMLDKERQRREDAIRTLAEITDDANDYEDLNLQVSQIDMASVDARIFELEDVLARAVVVEASQERAEQVSLGSLVVLQDAEHNREMQVQLVSAVEVTALAPGAAQVSEDSPVGKALLGRHVGESFEVDLGTSRVRYTVKSIGPS